MRVKEITSKFCLLSTKKQGRKRPLDTPKRRREREVKGAKSKPNSLPNAFSILCEWFSGRFLLKGRGGEVHGSEHLN